MMMSSLNAYEVLVKGLNSWNLPIDYVPCELLLVGKTAFPVLMNKKDQVLIAASHYGRGRMVVLSHEVYLQDEVLAQFLSNAVHWLNLTPDTPIGVHTSVQGLTGILRNTGMKVQTINSLEHSLGVYCIDAYDCSLASELVQFVENGGGLLIGAQALNWANKYGHDNVLHNFPGNQVTGVAGVYFTESSGDTDSLKLSKKVPRIPLTVSAQKAAMAISPSDAYEVLVKGLNSWNLPSEHVPSELLLIGEAAFPVLVNKKGQVLIAASHYGQGRMVVLSHEVYLQEDVLTQFLYNAVCWLNRRPGTPIGVHTFVQGLSEILCDTGLKVQTVNEPEDYLGVYCTNTYDITPANELIQFVKNGGGLLIGAHAWNWANKHGHEKVLSNFPGNQVTSVAGVYFTDAYGDTNFLKVSEEVPKIPLTIWFEENIFQDQKQLLDGITELDIDDGELPSQLLVHGALAFPLGIDSSLDCFLAAARYGRGRVVLAAHESMLSAPKLGRFLCNAVTWLAGDQTGRIGVNPDFKNLCSLLSGSGLKCSLESQLTTGLSVYCCSAYNDQEAKELHEFVAEGGGLLIGGQAWWWASQNLGKSAMADFPGNHILNPFGLSILDNCLESGQFPVLVPRKESYHFRSALSQFQDEVKGGKVLGEFWHSKLRKDCGDFLRIPAVGIPAYNSIHRFLKEMLNETGFPRVDEDHPVQGNSYEATLLCLATELTQSGIDCFSLVQGESDGIWPTKLYYPGPPITMEINGTSPDFTAWVSTGLYLPEGFTVNVRVKDASAVGLQVQIGCHSDDLSGAKKLYRAPVVIHRCSLDRPKLSMTSLWGGLIYILVPKGSNLGPVSITVTGAFPAPYFKLGETSLEQWKNLIRYLPAPWGELATDNIILTVPSELLQNLENPEPLLYLWDEVMEAVAKLASIKVPFPQPVRIVADVQLLIGWMHGGYPIMCHKETAKDLINEKSIRSKGIWGAIYEIGHNLVRPAWEFPPHTNEATCNLWSIYVHEIVLGIPRSQAHPALTPSNRETRIKEFLRKGASLEEWNDWTALETYLQLQEAFGWETFIHIFTEYQTLNEVPNNNEAKMNLWVKEFSHQVHKNLAPFFQSWGWPVQKEVADSLVNLSEWNPMKLYLLKENKESIE